MVKKKVEAVEASAPAKPYGLGYKRDAVDERDYAAHALLGAPANLPSEATSLRAHVRRIKNQLQTSSCVGQALCTAADTRLRFLGFDYEPSSLAAYVFARKTGGEKQLEDAGCVPRDAMKAVAALGIPLEQAWPFDQAKVDEEVPWDVVQAASKFLLFRWSRIYSTGPSRSDEIANALVKNYPVIFGLEIDNAFFDYAGGTIVKMNADDQGGHMLCIVGYRTDPDGKRAFLVVNSWSESWGEHGCCWISEDVFAGDRANDLYLVEISP